MSTAGGANAAPTINTRFTELVGVKYPIVQTGMGWVSRSSARSRRHTARR